MSDWLIKQGDLLPVIRYTLTGADGTPADLSDPDTVVRFILRLPWVTDPDDFTVDAEADIIDADDGIVEYAWQDGDTDLAGEYVAEWEVTYGDDPAGPETFPNGYTLVVEVRGDLDGAGVRDTFASVSELASALEVTLDSGDQKALVALRGATAAIQAECQHRIFRTVETKKLQGTWGPYIQLPEHPVHDVTAVTVTTGSTVEVLASDNFTFTRRGKLYIGAYSPIINGSDYWGFWHGPDSEVTVTYDHGYSTVPAELKDLCLQVAGRSFSNPSGVERESLGVWSATYATERNGVELSDSEKRICRRYRTPL